MIVFENFRRTGTDTNFGWHTGKGVSFSKFRASLAFLAPLSHISFTIGTPNMLREVSAAFPPTELRHHAQSKQ